MNGDATDNILISTEPASGEELWRGPISNVDAAVSTARRAWASSDCRVAASSVPVVSTTCAVNAGTGTWAFSASGRKSISEHRQNWMKGRMKPIATPRIISFRNQQWVVLKWPPRFQR